MTFRFDKLTIKAQEAVSAAQNLAAENGHPEVDAIHLLSTLLSESDGVVQPIFNKIGVDRDQMRGIVAAELSRLPKTSGGSQPQVNAGLREVLETSARDAGAMKDEFVSTEHLLVALTKGKTKAKQILELNGVREADILSALQTVRGSSRVTDQNPEGKYQALQKYGIDLVEAANAGKLDPVI